MALKKEIDRLIHPKKDELKGSLGISPSVVKVTNRPGYVWVRMFDNPSEIIPVHNSKVSPTYNLPVTLLFDGKKYEIDKVDTSRYGSWPTDSTFLPDHGPKHSARRGHEGNDIVWVDTQQFLPLLVVPANTTGSYGIQINPYIYLNSDDDWVQVGGTGVYSLQPISNTESNMYLVMLSDDTGGFYCITGTTFPVTISGSYGVVPYIPKVPNKIDIPVAAVRATPSVPSKWENIWDVRQFISSKISSQTNSNDYICVRHEEDSGVAGGTPTSGWNVHKVTTEISDDGNHCDIISNDTLRLDIGKYRFSIIATAFSANNAQLRLKDVANGVISQSEGLSTWVRNAVTVGDVVETRGVFEIVVKSDIQIEQYFDNAATDGFGVATNSGQKEVYCIAELWKIG